jgi:hypothetical protein
LYSRTELMVLVCCTPIDRLAHRLVEIKVSRAERKELMRRT